MSSLALYRQLSAEADREIAALRAARPAEMEGALELEAAGRPVAFPAPPAGLGHAVEGDRHSAAFTAGTSLLRTGLDDDERDLVRTAGNAAFPTEGVTQRRTALRSRAIAAGLAGAEERFFPEPEIDEIVTVLLSISSEALPEYWPENATALVIAAPLRAGLAGVLALTAAAGKAGLAKSPTVARAARTARARNLLVRKGLLTMQLSIPVGDERPIGPKDPTLAAVRLATGLEVLAFLSLRCLFQTCS